MNGGSKRRPSHRLVLQHDPEKNPRAQTEVGALWPHERGEGFSVTIKRGLAVSLQDGARLHAFVVDDENERQRSSSSSAESDGPGHRARGGKSSRERSSSSKGDNGGGDDDIPF